MKSSTNFNIFLVDDDSMFLKALEHNVTKLLPNVKIKTFQSGEECLSGLSERPDAIVLDYFLPGLNGLNTFKQIKESFPRMPVILLSTNTDNSTIERLIAEGAYEYIIKTKYCIDGLKLSLRNIIEKQIHNPLASVDGNDYMLLFQDIGGES